MRAAITASALLSSGLLLACGGSGSTATATVVAPPARAAAGAAPIANEVSVEEARLAPGEAIAQWHALWPTGASYEAALAALPDDPELKKTMARALLRGGNFACAPVTTHVACGHEWLELAPLQPSATFGEPCLRRHLALWSLAQLEGEDAAGVADALVGLVSLPAPETELQAAAFALLDPDDDALRLRLLGHAEGELADAQAGQLVGGAALERAAVDLHLDAAVTKLSDTPDGHRAALLAALADDQLAPSTRGALIDRFAADGSEQVTDTLAAIAGEPDCELSMRAAVVLADRGDPSHLPARPRSFDLDAHMRAICRLQFDPDEVRRDTRLGAWIGAAGVEFVSEEVDDYFEETGDPADHETTVTATGELLERDGRLTRVRRRASRADAEVEAFALMSVYGWSCDDAGTCRSDESTSELGFATDGSSLVLSRITTHPFEGCGC